jgi:molybdopterin converting factor subunit 1
MIVRVKLFAVARQRAGSDAVEVEVLSPNTVANLRRALGEQHPSLAGLLPHAKIAIDSEYAGDAAVIMKGVEVAIIPPVSGG